MKNKKLSEEKIQSDSEDSETENEFKPPEGFKNYDKHIINKEDLKNKQIIIFKIPKGVKLNELDNIPGLNLKEIKNKSKNNNNNNNNKNQELILNDKEYKLDEKDGKDVMLKKINIACKDGENLKVFNMDVNKIIEIKEIVKIPEINLNSFPKETYEKIQPKELRQRYAATGCSIVPDEVKISRKSSSVHDEGHRKKIKRRK